MADIENGFMDEFLLLKNKIKELDEIKKTLNPELFFIYIEDEDRFNLKHARLQIEKILDQI